MAADVQNAMALWMAEEAAAKVPAAEEVEAEAKEAAEKALCATNGEAGFSGSRNSIVCDNCG